MSIINHITQVHVTGPNFAAAAYVRLSYVHCTDIDGSATISNESLLFNNANPVLSQRANDSKATTIT